MITFPLDDSAAFAPLDMLHVPIWVFDLDRHAIHWANGAALDFWRAETLAELRERDFSGDSDSVRRRLRQIAKDSGATAQSWTLYPRETPVEVAVNCQPVTLARDRLALLVELIPHESGTQSETTRRLREAQSYSDVMQSMFSMTGALLAQNAATHDCFAKAGEVTLASRLGDSAVAQELLNAVESGTSFDRELPLTTAAGPRTHRVRAYPGRDPVTGARAVVLSQDDVSDVVRLREDLSDLNANLEKRVAERNESLRISEERFSLAMRGTSDGVWDHNMETGEVYLSPRWFEMLGLAPNTPPPDPETFLSMVHPKDRAAMTTLVINPDPLGEKSPALECRLRHSEGHWVDVLVRGYIQVRDGRVTRKVGTHVDITPMKVYERKLRRLQEILFEGGAALPLGVAFFDPDLKLVMHNDRYREMLSAQAHLLERGVGLEVLLRHSAPSISQEFGYDSVEAYLRDRLQSARTAPRDWLHTLPNGRIVKATELPTSGGGVIGLIEDLTEDRNREKQLYQAQKMEALGQLTGGVAHDFNNLLAVIMGNLELLQWEAEAGTWDPSEANGMIASAIQAVKHGAELTASMLAYARKARLAPTLVDPNETVRDTERWMRRTIASNIEIETVIQAGIWPIRVDQSSLQSSLVNLILNARDAMPGGGKLTIETANLRIDDSYVESRGETIEPGRYVMVAVTDTGIGMSPETMEHIYEPFFTTKSVGEGTGLGLSMVEGFVKQSGGTIRVYSEPGAGTSFKLYFRAEQSGRLQADIRPPEELSTAPEGGAVRLLLAEDKPEVMAVLQKTLTSAGYDVVGALSGDQAYAVFQDDPSFDLVVTDIVMPGDLQGPSLAKACRALRADIPFIFLSGYASEATVHGNGLRPEDIRLMKPVSRHDLLIAVQKGLNPLARRG